MKYPTNLVIGGTFNSSLPQTICGQAEVNRRLYRKFKGTDRDWYVGLIPNTIELDPNHIYCADPQQPKHSGMQGFGGATLTFDFEDGTSDSVKGPWHSNTDALLSQTGVDLTKCIITWGCIGTGRESSGSGYTTIITNLMHFDPFPLPGEFSRIEKLARQLSKAQDDRPLVYYSQSYGGSSCGWVNYKQTTTK
jgi:hypothetical protein